MDLQQFYMGEAFDAYEYFGAHPEKDGVVFRTYAPNAHRITIVGAFTSWQEQPMEQLYQSGVWTGFCKDARPGQLYKYVIYGQNGWLRNGTSSGGLFCHPGFIRIRFYR